MSSVPVFVGLDYHQDSVQVCIVDREGVVLCNRKVADDREKIAGVVQAYGVPVGVAIESCSGAADLADELVTRAGWSVDLAHPGFVSRMKQNPDKTDYSDARLLADLERVGYLPRVWLAPHDVRELRRLVRFRQQWVDQRRAIKQRIRALLREQRAKGEGLRAWSKAWLEWLKNEAPVSVQGRWVLQQHLLDVELAQKRILAVEKRLQTLTRKDVVVQALQQEKGIGPVTAWTMRAEIGRFDRFRTGKQLSRFCGLTPCNASSGERQADAGIIRAGNPQLRATLIETGWRLIQAGGEWRRLAESLRIRGKKPCVIVVAVANRWIRRLFHRLQPANLAGDVASPASSAA